MKRMISSKKRGEEVGEGRQGRRFNIKKYYLTTFVVTTYIAFVLI